MKLVIIPNQRVTIMLIDTLAGHQVSDLPGPAPVEANDAVVPHDAPAAVAHAVDVQIAAPASLGVKSIFNRARLFLLGGRWVLLGGGWVLRLRLSRN